MNQTLKLPVGIENFEDIRKLGFYYIDKTKLIEQLLQNWGKVNLFTRPRRFGKTLNMSMLRTFFEIGIDKSLFEGLYISKNKECATINKIDDFHYELYAFDNNENIGKIITVTVAIGDYLRTFSYTIGAIPIESMTLYNAETQTELDSTISLTRGGILKVSAVINPVNASLKEVSYNIFADIPYFYTIFLFPS